MMRQIAPMVRVLFLYLLLGLGGCVTADQPGMLVTQQTGLAGGHSERRVVSDHWHFTIYAQAAVIAQAGQVTHTVFLSHALGDGSAVFVDDVWADGSRLAYHPVPRDRVCGGTGCTFNIGVIGFTPAGFGQAASTGVSARLITSEGPIDIHLPPLLFAQAARQAGALDL